MHTIFNIVTTLLLLPFGSYLAKAAEKILPEKAEEKQEQMHLEYLRPIEMKGESHIGLSAILLNDIKRELSRMLEMTKENVRESFEIVLGKASEKLADVEAREAYIDFLNKEISKYIAKALVSETNVKTTKRVSALFKVCGNLERIGDHAMNISEYTKLMHEKGIVLSPDELSEISDMQKTSILALEALETIAKTSDKNIKAIEQWEQKIDDMTEQFRANQTVRMQKGKTSDEACVIYSEMLTDFERIGDHVLNIGQEMGKGKVGA